MDNTELDDVIETLKSTVYSRVQEEAYWKNKSSEKSGGEPNTIEAGRVDLLIEDVFNSFFEGLKNTQSNTPKVKGNNEAKTPIEITLLVGDCRQTLDQLMNGKEPHWTKVSVAVALGTGRRMAEIHSLGQFEVTGDYALHFTGQAKTRGAEDAKTDYFIPTLFRAATLKRAIEYLDEQKRRLAPEVQKRDRNAVNRAYAMALSRVMDKYPGINYKGLRAIYAEFQWALLPETEKAKTSQHRKYSDWLGHIDRDGEIDTTFVSYMVYNVTDIEAVKGQLRKDLLQRSSLG
jgi:hypothetical protein